MAPRMDDIMRLCCDISANQQVKVAVQHATRGAIVAAGTAFVGGILAGPAGIAVGGAVGGLLGAWLTSGQFKPLPQILMELPPNQQQKLYSDIMAVLGNLDWTDMAQLAALVMGNAKLKQQVTAALLSYITKELSAELLSAAMAPRMDDIMRLCCDISANQQVKVAVQHATRAAIVAGGTVFVGGILAGPAGIAVGVAVGGLLGAWLTSGQFKPLPQILMELPPNQQQKLYSDIMAVLGNLDWTDMAQLAALVMGNAKLKQQVTAALLSYITKELSAELLSAAMAPRMDDIMRLCCDISANQQVKVAVQHATRGAIVAGGTVFVGGILAGPAGIAVGVAVGGLLGAWLTSGQFKPLPQILMELPPNQQQKLYSDIMAVLGNLDWTDMAQLAALVMGNAKLKQQVTAALLSYITKELSAELLSAAMAQRMDDIMRLCCDISANQQVKVAVQHATRGAIVAAGTAFVGGILAGPAGIAVGGAVGGLLGAWLTSGQFKPLPQILMELPPNQQQKLYSDIMAVLGNLDWTDMAQLAALVMGNAKLKQQVTAALLSYITKELSAELLSAAMAPRMDDIMRLCCDISANQQVKVAVQHATRAAIVAGGTVFVGGILAGPAGIAVGGAVGGLLGAWLTSGQFKPLPQILMELPPNQQQKLYSDIMAVLGNLDWTDMAQLAALVMGNAKLKQQVTAALLSYITKELSAELLSAAMAPRMDDIMRLCCDISANQQVKVAVQHVTRAAIVAGGTVFVGGILAGPAGIAVGVAVGGLLGAWLTSGQFKPLPQILMELPPNQQQKLYSDIMAVLGNLDWTDMAQLAALVMGNAKLKQQVTAALLSYITKELSAELLSAAMAPRMDDIMRLCCDISANQQVKVAVQHATRGAIVAAGTAFVGGILAGPAGIAVGGAVGGLLGAWLTSGQFKPLPQILMELPPNQQQKLYSDIMAVLGNLDWTDMAQLAALVMGNAKLKQQVTAALLSYITKELGAEVRYGD